MEVLQCLGWGVFDVFVSYLAIQLMIVIYINDEYNSGILLTVDCCSESDTCKVAQLTISWN